jgi:hypothetical protein
MFSSAFFGIVALLYYLSCGLLAFLALLVAFWSPRTTRDDRRSARLRHTFLLLAVCLLLWQGTLFLEIRSNAPAVQLGLSRANFAVMASAAGLALHFVRLVARKAPGSHSPWRRRVLGVWMAETAALTLLTLLTPWVDAAESVAQGRAVSTYGPLFPLYLLHIAAHWLAALAVAFRERRRAARPVVRDQLTLIGLGMLGTGAVALVTNALLPYWSGDFRYCDVGVLSTLLFLLAVAYATLWRRLFDLRLFLRKTLVYGVLLTGVLGVYSSTVFVVSQQWTAQSDSWTQFAVLVIAFSFDPLRRFLERKTDQWLFEPRGEAEAGKPQRSSRSGSRFILSLLFPWRR